MIMAQGCQSSLNFLFFNYIIYVCAVCMHMTKMLVEARRECQIP